MFLVLQSGFVFIKNHHSHIVMIKRCSATVALSNTNFFFDFMHESITVNDIPYENKRPVRTNKADHLNC